MSTNDIRVEREGPVGLISLDRPQKRNALTEAMRAGILQALEELEKDPAIRVIVFRGEGDQAFCAGTDVGEFLGRTGHEQWNRDLSPDRIFERIQGARLPSIAMLHGHVYGGGCELALACDVRIASEGALFGQLELRFGLIPGGGGTQRLTRLVGRGQAMRLILGGEVISAQEALRIGLVEMVVPESELRQAVAAIAGRIAAHDPVAVRLARESIASVDELGLKAGLRYEASLMAICMYAGGNSEQIEGFLGRAGS